MARYIVDAETKPGIWCNVYRGDDKENAKSQANFWDERVNVRYRDTVLELALMTPLERAMQKFDLAVEKLAVRG